MVAGIGKGGRGPLNPTRLTQSAGLRPYGMTGWVPQLGKFSVTGVSVT